MTRQNADPNGSSTRERKGGRRRSRSIFRTGGSGKRQNFTYLTASLAAVVLMIAMAALSVIVMSGVGGLYLISQISAGRAGSEGAEVVGHSSELRPVAELSADVIDRQAVLLETLTNLIERIDALEASRDSMAVAATASERAIRDLRWQMNSSGGPGGELLPLDELGMVSGSDGLLEVPAVDVVESQR